MTSFFPLFYKVSGHIYFLTFSIFLVFTVRFIRNRPFNQLHLPIHEVIFYGIFILVDNGSIICVKVEKREVSAIRFYFPIIISYFRILSQNQLVNTKLFITYQFKTISKCLEYSTISWLDFLYLLKLLYSLTTSLNTRYTFSGVPSLSSA